MQPISVVIITRNAAHLLAATLQSVKDLTDDIVVCDTGSNDATIPVAVLGICGSPVVRDPEVEDGDHVERAPAVGRDVRLDLDAHDVPPL